MIPYALIMIRARFADGSSKGMSVSEVLSDGVVLSGDAHNAVGFDAHFRNAAGKYDSVSIERFTLDANTLRTRDAAFRSLLTRTIREYTRYIYIRSETDESDLTEALTGRGYDHTYTDSLDSWLEKRAGTGVPEWDLPDVEIGVPSEGSRLKNAHVFCTRATHIYIGIELCPLRFEEGEVRRALETGLTPVVCFAPMADEMTQTYLNRLRFLYSEGVRELEINDIGTALMIREAGLDFSLCAGPLLIKRRNDPRIPATQEGDVSRIYLNYLKSLGIRHFACESRGCFKGADVVHLPLQRTNISTFCPLRSAVCEGGRGAQKAGGYCARYCREKMFYYPDGLNMIGIGNSLYGIDADAINDINKLRIMIESGVSRLVVNI